LARKYLYPNSEHLIDWFHITMRLTVLQQQTKAMRADRPDDGSAASKQIESIKHLLWHGNVDESLERIDNPSIDLDLTSRQSAPAGELAAGLWDLRTYIGNNRNRSGTTGSGHRSHATGAESASGLYPFHHDQYRRLWQPMAISVRCQWVSAAGK
jgi:hypothetical protein